MIHRLQSTPVRVERQLVSPSPVISCLETVHNSGPRCAREVDNHPNSGDVQHFLWTGLGITKIPLDLLFRVLHSVITTEEHGRFSSEDTPSIGCSEGRVNRPATGRVSVGGTIRLIGRGSTTGPGPRGRGKPRHRGPGRKRETVTERGASGVISMHRTQSGIARQSARTDGRCGQIERQATAGSSICGGSPDAGRPGQAWFRPGRPGRSHIRFGLAVVDDTTSSVAWGTGLECAWRSREPAGTCLRSSGAQTAVHRHRHRQR